MCREKEGIASRLTRAQAGKLQPIYSCREATGTYYSLFHCIVFSLQLDLIILCFTVFYSHCNWILLFSVSLYCILIATGSYYSLFHCIVFSLQLDLIILCFTVLYSLCNMKAAGGVQGGAAEADSLDSFMSTVSTQLDPVKRIELRHQLQELKKVLRCLI